MSSETPKNKSRRFLQGVAVLVTSLAGYAGVVDTASAATTPGVSAPAGQSPGDFVIAPTQSPGPVQFDHESHESHSSHDSHASHSSHSSHTSGS